MKQLQNNGNEKIVRDVEIFANVKLLKKQLGLKQSGMHFRT